MWEDYLSNFELRMNEATWLKRTIYAWGTRIGLAEVERMLLDAPTRRSTKLALALANCLVYRPVRDQLGLLKATHVYSGGGALGQEVTKYFLALRVPIKQIYGQTEAGITTTHWDRMKPGTMGRPVPGVEVLITENHEIAHRGPSVFLGYHKNDAATAEVLKDGLLLSGDEGYLDDDGHLVVVDRIKNMAKLQTGERFSPTFIERERVAYTTYTDLSQRPEVIELIRLEIRKINQSMPDYLNVGRLAILHKEFDADDAEITRTKQIRRNVVEERYAFIIEALYAGQREVHVDASVKYRDGRQAQVRTVLQMVDVMDSRAAEKVPNHA